MRKSEGNSSEITETIFYLSIIMFIVSLALDLTELRGENCKDIPEQICRGRDFTIHCTELNAKSVHFK